MVNTRGHPLGDGDLRDVSLREPNPVVRTPAVVPPSMPPIFTRRVEPEPRVELAPTNPVVLVANPQADMMASVMQMVTSAMEKQQETFLKMLEDRDPSSKRPEAMAENVVVGSGGVENRVRSEEHRVIGASKEGKSCSYKSFLGCRPPEFSGSEDPRLHVSSGSERSNRLSVHPSVVMTSGIPVNSWTSWGLVRHVASTEKEKIKAYLKGLPSDMMTMVRNSKASNLRETIAEAQFMEEVYAKSKPEKAVVVTEKRNSQQDARWCQKCRTRHHGNCNTPSQSCYKCGNPDHVTHDGPIRRIVCYECKTPGHIKIDCPKLVSSSATAKRENPPRVPGRAFQMTTEEAKVSADVVSGTFLINSVPARVLFDTGASFSFISELFRQKIVMPTTSLEDALVVEIADGSQVLIRNVLTKCTLGIEGIEFSIDLLPMLIGGFDVVVGMDLLANNHAEIMCSKKLIRLPNPCGEVVIIYGEKRKGDVAIITMAKARKCLVKGCSSFLAYVIDTKLEKSKLVDVKIVREYPDVFPDNLPGLPPNR
ncbi:hypothetical protein L6452_06171 [Arctium lappa]|uniref:Uncharacterized protein n=1 Tax=Arctium lappa TaxID=4217 RepID=A0ACB9EHY9_ARCLA|nr:hypothetical protein L6452_06171 [Arctium lappa]